MPDAGSGRAAAAGCGWPSCVSGAQTNELPTPSSDHRQQRPATAGCRARSTRPAAPARRRAPRTRPPARTRGWTRSVRRPAIGASTIDTTAIGASSSAGLGRRVAADQLCPAASAGSPSPRTTNADGRDGDVGEREVAVAEQAAAARAARCVLRGCHHTKTASTTMPPTISRHTVIGPASDQSYCVALLDAEDQQEHAGAAERDPEPVEAVPVRLERAGRAATPGTKPTMPTGMLMKKIHSQPSVSTSTPPRIGPTSVATPAVAPHRPSPSRGARAGRSG